MKFNITKNDNGAKLTIVVDNLKQHIQTDSVDSAKQLVEEIIIKDKNINSIK